MVVAVPVESNMPPVVEVVPDVSSGKAPLQVHFDGDAYDEDGLIQRVEWDFEGDGSFEVLNNLSDIERPLLGEAVKQGLQKEFIYTKPGIYHALVRATDDKGESSVSSVTIQVYSDIPWLDVTASNKEEFTSIRKNSRISYCIHPNSTTTVLKTFHKRGSFTSGCSHYSRHLYS